MQSQTKRRLVPLSNIYIYSGPAHHHLPHGASMPAAIANVLQPDVPHAVVPHLLAEAVVTTLRASRTIDVIATATTTVVTETAPAAQMTGS